MRSPRSGRERAVPRRRSSATGIPTIAIPTISKPCPSHQPRSRQARRSAAGSALASQTMPTATRRSPRRRVRRNVRSARQKSSAKKIIPRDEHGERHGTAAARARDGTRLGSSSAATPRPRMSNDPAARSPRSGRTAAGRRSAGTTPSARIAAPNGKVAPPVNATTPLIPTRTPGVASPCRQRSAAITENALPTRTAWPSRCAGSRDGQRNGGDRRDACAERDACEVEPAVEGHAFPPTKCRSATGTTAANAARPSTEPCGSPPELYRQRGSGC